ncbi:hypothetical protein Esti_005386 [Eimeria stiedai]
MGDAIVDSPLVECPDTQRHSLSAPSAALDAESCYCKVLVTNHLAGIIIGQAGHEIRTLKNTTGAKIVLSPHGMYFPGTTERIAAIEGPEQAVFQVLDWILDKMVDQRQLLDLPLEQHHQLQQQLQQQQEEQEHQHGGSTGGLVSPAASTFPPRATCFRICVPRAVVGCLIGKNGGYIQSLRVATGAAINVSPLFVTAEEACAERVVSVESRRRQSLKTAAFTLVRKINSHPERASCRHVCYFRKHSFESPLPTLDAAMQQPAAADFRLIRQQQRQQQQEIDALRRRTVSLVMGASSSTALPPALVDVRREASDKQQQHQQQQRLGSLSARHSTGSSAGDNQFAAFKRFCESRGVGKSSRSSSSSSAGGPPSQNLSFAASPAPSGSKLEPVAALSPVAQPDNTVAAAAAAAVAATMAKGSSSSSSKLGPSNNLWDCCPSTVCSTAVGSTDRLPLVTDERLRLSQRSTAAQQHMQQQQQQQQQHMQQQHLQQQHLQQTQYPSIVLLAIIAFLLAALLRLLMQSN